jgi:hypothetical protein
LIIEIRLVFLDLCSLFINVTNLLPECSENQVCQRKLGTTFIRPLCLESQLVGFSEEKGERKMGRAPCCDKANVKRGPWSPEEDAKLKEYMAKHGTGGNWIALPQKAGKHKHLFLFLLVSGF